MSSLLGIFGFVERFLAFIHFPEKWHRVSHISDSNSLR